MFDIYIYVCTPLSTCSAIYTHADVQSIVTYAKNRAIRVLPEFDGYCTLSISLSLSLPI